MEIRRAVEADFDAMWRVFQAVVATGDTYVFSPATTRQDAFAYWFGPGMTSYVAIDGLRILGMYKLRANQRDLGSHVANASFMVDPAAQGTGTGKALGHHCLREAQNAGYKAMQFNFVVSTNIGAVSLWKKLGFSIVGTVPKAFRHHRLGYVDVYVMHRFLNELG
ncbi:MAG: GNAT family N-acetyltransferase [Candidatus Rokuibacteriota bacterium]|nr:MAG: GNAT family N-acetyltransferase [Candidatus Rokubacteria bacterium]